MVDCAFAVFVFGGCFGSWILWVGGARGFPVAWGVGLGLAFAGRFGLLWVGTIAALGVVVLRVRVVLALCGFVMWVIVFCGFVVVVCVVLGLVGDACVGGCSVDLSLGGVVFRLLVRWFGLGSSDISGCWDALCLVD